MQHFYKFAYANRQEADQEYERRVRSPVAKVLPLAIKPIRQRDTFRLYYLPTDAMLRLVGDIYRKDAEIVSLVRQRLPRVAVDCFVRESLIDELQSTNDMEGVRSTRRELAAGIEAAQTGKRQNVRFLGMARAYQRMMQGDSLNLSEPKDIRRIYDELTEGEIAQENQPDGELFRKDAVHVKKVSGTGATVHEGVLPEARIVEGMEAMIRLVDDAQIPLFIRIAVSHYYFGYIHPFYDGNGRTSRFISSILFRRELSEFSAISLSRACSQQRTGYARLFEHTNSAANRGEMNAFIEGFLSLLLEGQSTVLHELQEKAELLDHAQHSAEHNERLGAIGAEAVLLFYLFAQNYYFADDAGFTVNDIKRILQNANRVLPDYRLRALLHQLRAEGVLTAKGERPRVYHLSQAFLEGEIAGGT